MDVQPGQTINPGESPKQDNTKTPDVELPKIETPSGQVTPESATTSVPNPPLEPSTPDISTQTPPNNIPEVAYVPDAPTTDMPPINDIGSVDWSASEFIDHDKQIGWFLGLAVVALVSAGLMYLLTQEYITPVVIIIAATLFGVTASRKPGTKQYHIDSQGIKIGDKSFSFDKFKSFSVIEEGMIESIQLTPLARLATPISLYFPPDQEDKIFGMLANYLPHEDRRHDPVDRLMRRIRF